MKRGYTITSEAGRSIEVAPRALVGLFELSRVLQIAPSKAWSLINERAPSPSCPADA